MRNFKQKILGVIIACIMLVYILYPAQCTELHIKIYLADDSAPKTFTLYYATEASPDLSDSQTAYAEAIDKQVDIVLPKELCEKLTTLRLDLHHSDALIAIDRVELCSGGFIQQSYDGATFFDKANIHSTNDIAVMQSVGNVFYIGTAGSDPYIFLQPSVIQTCNEAYSHYTVTKIFICLFFISIYILAHKKLFTAD